MLVVGSGEKSGWKMERSRKQKSEINRTSISENAEVRIWRNERYLHRMYTFIHIRVMSFSRFHNSQFDAFVSNFVHDFNWFLIRSIYSCHVSPIIIGRQIMLHRLHWLTDWLIWLKYFNTRGLWVKRKMISCWLHYSETNTGCVHVCVVGFHFCVVCSFYLTRMSLTTNGTSGVQLKFSHLIELMQNQEKSKRRNEKRRRKTKKIKFSECRKYSTSKWKTS